MLTTREISALMKAVSQVVREHVGAVQSSLTALIQEHVREVKTSVDSRFQDLEEKIQAIPAGEKGEKGEKGEAGQAIQGPRGQSAYDLAVDKGFKGTVEDWLSSLRGQDGEKGTDGKDVDMQAVTDFINKELAALVPTHEQLREWVRESVSEAVEKLVLPKGEKGEKGDTPDIAPVVAQVTEFLEKADEQVRESLQKAEAFVRNIPLPKDGRDGRDVDPTLLTELIKAQAPAAPNEEFIRGVARDVAQEEITDKLFVDTKLVEEIAGREATRVTAQLVKPIVEEAVAQIPVPKDGHSVTAEDVLPALQEQLKEAIAALPIPKDGKDGVDGRSVSLDDVKQYLDNNTATWALDFERRAHDVLQRTIDRMPKPENGKDGKDGINGKDGLGFDDLSLEYDGHRTATLVFKRGEEEKRYPVVLPIPIFKDIFQSGVTYDKGDLVVFDGSLWIAKSQTGTKPPSPEWRQATRRGRDGKDGERGPKGEPGPKGRDGRDLTQLVDGRKY